MTATSTVHSRHLGAHLPTTPSPTGCLHFYILSYDQVKSLVSLALLKRKRSSWIWFLPLLPEWVSLGEMTRRKGMRPWLSAEYNTLIRSLPHTSEPLFFAGFPALYMLWSSLKTKKPSILCPGKFHMQSSLFKWGFNHPRNKYAPQFLVCGWHTQAIHFLKTEDLIFQCMKIMSRETPEEKGCADNHIKIIKIPLCLSR